ncbi:isovaleryl-CoA dehydrogenase [Solitalea longa]|uniref:Isovaleryl-CoA dehydrogenase n=1 Tax=Solitalea longa TaxID=2079460 RepID=A0A2S5A9X6_9SPHI|nr:isovaleryl-CoA dehydrogenase [Solitalea longa]POY39401.1 isovaleryl-CoA dehydrogenase [Solitalea longa]
MNDHSFGSLRFKTHEVFNQSTPLVNYNLYTSNRVLRECMARMDTEWAEKSLKEFGGKLGAEEIIRSGFLANQYPPILRTHDRFGERINEVDFHPSWHQLLQLAMENRLHNLPWSSVKKGAHSVRAAMMMMASEIEFGHLCPISMTFSVFPVLKKHAPQFLDQWSQLILSNQYDQRFIPADEKNGVLCGMAMTEKQGGSDVRANTSIAKALNENTEFLLTGHKWFCSAPMVDAFLVLAQAPKGLSCFFMPRYLPDGTLNNFHIQRLKDKLGNRSNASGEIEFYNAWALLIGEEGRGIPTIIEMVNHTRLDCTIGSTGLMHQATVQAIHHCLHRSAFGKRLIDQPLMQNVLADLTLETEAAMQLTMRLAAAFDNAEEQALQRIITPIAKFWICKRTPPLIYEALECFGGAGFIEDSIMPRLYREAPLNSVWEGSGNVICLDVKRAMQNQPAAVESIINELNLAKGINSSFDTHLIAFSKIISASLTDNEAESRILVEKMALLLQAALLLRFSPAFMAEAFIDSRLNNSKSLFGTLSSQHNFQWIIGRMWTEE